MKLPTIKELTKQIQTKNGKYSGTLANKLFQSYIKHLTDKQLFTLAKRLSLAKWSIPKLIQAVKNGNADKGISRRACCGLCFYDNYTLLRVMHSHCGECRLRGFHCSKYRRDDIHEVKQMIKDIKALKY